MSTIAIWFLCSAAVWVVTGLLAYSLLLGNWTAEWPEFSTWLDAKICGLVGLLGPFGLAAVLTELRDRRFFPPGLKFRFRLCPLPANEVWRIRAEKYPDIDRVWWEAVMRWKKPAQETRAK